MTLLFTTLLILHHAILSSATMTATTFKQTLLDDHNAMRTKVASGVLTGYSGYSFPKAADMIQLEWSDTIAAVAQSYAEGCNWGHSQHATYGENIAMTTFTWDVDELKNRIKAWLDDEAVNTEFTGSGVNYGDIQCSGVCGHFTQGIWAETAELGCGYDECSAATNPSGSSYGTWTYLVCNYFTRGNIRVEDQEGNVLNSVYTTDTSSCTSCPTGYQNCVNHLCAASTPVPTSLTSSPTLSPTDNPAAGPSSSDIYFCNYMYGGFNGVWTYNPVNRYTKHTSYSNYPNPFVMYSVDFGSGPWFAIYDDAGNGYYALCKQSTLSSCTAGQWEGDSDAYISSSSCPAAAESNIKLEASHSFKSIEEQPIDNKSYPLNMTETHVILGILILVLIIMCGMIFGFFYYLKKNKKNEKQIAIAQENEMVYFERANDEHNTPTVEHLKDSNQNQPSLKINVNGTATMVTKLPTTTPVTPLINLDHDYE